MTGEPQPHHVPVIIAKRKNILSALCTLHTSYVAEGGTLADLRVALEGDRTMATNDTFYAQGIELGKTGERHVKWATAHEAGCVTILSPHTANHAGNIDPNVENGDRDDRVAHSPPTNNVSMIEILDYSAGLASGVDVSSPDGPRRSGLPVVANLPISQIDIVGTDHEVDEVVVASSVREAAYGFSGWTKRSIDASLLSLRARCTTSAGDLSSPVAISVLGRHVFSKCVLTLGNQLRAHPAFEDAVVAALSTSDEDERSANLASVLARFGHVYVSSVEMGGMKYISGTMNNETQRTKEQHEEAMRWTLEAKFDPLSAGTSGNTASTQDTENKETLGFARCVIHTVGGAAGAISLSSWMANLASPENWAVTRVISVEPTINLFNEDIRSRIVAATPQRCEPPPPLYPQIVETGKVWSKPLAHQNSRHIDFAHRAQSSPQVLLGLRALDCDHSKHLRIECPVDAVTSTSVDIDIRSWDNTIDYGTCCSWLKIPPNDVDIQCGTYDIANDHPSYKPQEVTTYRITFARPYTAEPKLAAWFYKLDLDSGRQCRATVNVMQVTCEGFTVRVGTWGNSIIYGAGVSWIAISPSRTDITCGGYSTLDVKEPGRISPHTSGRHTFSGVTFTSPPQLFLAISLVDFEKGRNARFNELCATKVTAEGFEWHLDTRGDSLMHTASAAYVAFSS